jgi:hypothetical protein
MASSAEAIPPRFEQERGQRDSARISCTIRPVKRTLLAVIAVAIVAAALGAWVAWRVATREPPPPDPAALVLKIREVARLQTLDVSLYKKVTFAPDPGPPADSLWKNVAAWAKHSLRAPNGKAIVFAEAHLGVDLRRLDASHLRVTGRRVDVVLPPVQVQVELKPGDTEIIGSNLDSQETSALFEKARAAFEAQVSADEGLRDRARESARQSLRSLFSGLGFTEVNFVAQLPPERSAG